MKLEDSLLHLQAPTTCPCLSQISLVDVFPSHFLKIHFNIIILSTPSFPSGLFPSDLYTKTLHAPLLSVLYVLRAPPILFFLILYPKLYFVSKTEH